MLKTIVSISSIYWCQDDPKTCFAILKIIWIQASTGRSTILRLAASSSTENLELAGVWPCPFRIGYISTRIAPNRIQADFHDVAMHVIQTPRIGKFPANRSYGINPSIILNKGVTGIIPKAEPCRCSCTAGIFPLSFDRQPILKPHWQTTG